MARTVIAVALALVGLAGAARAGQAVFYIEVANKVDKVTARLSPTDPRTFEIGGGRRFKMAVQDVKDSGDDVTIAQDSMAGLYLDVYGPMTTFACEVKAPSRPVTIASNGGTAEFVTKVTASANGCNVAPTTCVGTACK